MKKSRFSEEQIIGILKQAENGRGVAELAREHGVTETTLYRWSRKIGDMEVSDARRLKELEEENRKLKRMVADQALDIVALKDVVSKKW
jgi:putative transposase